MSLNRSVRVDGWWIEWISDGMGDGFLSFPWNSNNLGFYFRSWRRAVEATRNSDVFGYFHWSLLRTKGNDLSAKQLFSGVLLKCVEAVLLEEHSLFEWNRGKTLACVLFQNLDHDLNGKYENCLQMCTTKENGTQVEGLKSRSMRRGILYGSRFSKAEGATTAVLKTKQSCW